MPEHRYINRELSWLAFNRRVLEEAQDARNPLLERARFLGIVANNLDEFCMVRMPGLHGVVKESDPDHAGLKPAVALALVREEIRAQVADASACWASEVEPALRGVGLEIVPPSAWTEAERHGLHLYYRNRLEPVLTPLAVDPARPFPLLANQVIHIAVVLRPSGGGARHRALVTVPGGDRLLALAGERRGRYALIEDVVEHFLSGLFRGFEIVERCRLRITRDGSLDLDDDRATDMLSGIEEELRSRAHGRPMRLEIAADASEGLRAWLMKSFSLDEEDVVAIAGPLDPTFLLRLDPLLDDPALRYPPFTPLAPGWEDPFAALRAADRLLHHPYESFAPVVDLVARAAADPEVLAIKQTLYRVSGDSPIVQALVRAALAGKQVTVLLELKARFDEKRNIQWARRLEQAGAHVIYGLVGYKVHAKLLLIIRREATGIRRYCHIGTGNYNDRTARQYTDLSYFTANEAVGRDVASMFNMLTGFSIPPEWERLIPSPTIARDAFTQYIRREAEHARAGRGGRITAWFNSLFDARICDELYEASQAGVAIDLVVRGICILRPGVKGLSENIRVRSIIGRFLEHGRVFRFANAGAPVHLIGSADWMTRNLDRRVECLVRIDDPALRARLDDILDLLLADDRSARVLDADGRYRRLHPKQGRPGISVQERLLAASAAAATRDSGRRPQVLVPQRRSRPSGA